MSMRARDIRFVVAEFMYQPPPTDPRARQLFEWAVNQRLAPLTDQDRMVFICNSDAIVKAVLQIAANFPATTIIANPQAADMPAAAPFDWGGMWQRMTMTDRWSRIIKALEIGRDITLNDLVTPLPEFGEGLGVGSGYLLMPAHDAVYSRDLLDRLIAFSRQHAQNGLPAAVSPYTYHQHSPLPTAAIPQSIVDIVNAAFNRDPAFRLPMERGETQGFWGKMGLIPFEMCGALLEKVNTGIWEDDLEIDRAINELGYASRALWVDDPTQYRHVLPVFDEAGVRRVIERHLHYSLRTGGSHLTQSLTDMARYQRVINPKFAESSAWADRIIAEEYARMMRRVDQHGASWVDWGAYRYVARPYDPHVEVWREVES